MCVDKSYFANIPVVSVPDGYSTIMHLYPCTTPIEG